MKFLDYRWFIYVSVLALFVFKGLDLAAIAEPDDLDFDDDFEDAVDDFVSALVPEMSNEFTLHNSHLADTIKVMQTNFANDESQNEIVVHAMLEVFKNNAFDELQISAKGSFFKNLKIRIKDKINSTDIKNKMKKYGKKLKNKSAKYGKKMLAHIKNISKRCFKNVKEEVKKLPKEIAKDAGKCASSHIENGMVKLSENCDISALPLSLEEIQAQINACLTNTQTNAISCILDIGGEFGTIMTTKESGSDKSIMEEVLANILGCMNPDEFMNRSINAVTTGAIKCIADSMKDDADLPVSSGESVTDAESGSSEEEN